MTMPNVSTDQRAWITAEVAQTSCPVFSTTYIPFAAPFSPLNPDFCRFPAFRVENDTGSPTIILTHSTHRNFQVSPWKSLT